jgi:cytochrome c biogenesis protein CcmG/thiol:disulfide interchange protein DsbE
MALLAVLLTIFTSFGVGAETFSAQDRRVGAFQAEFMASQNMKPDNLFMPKGTLVALSEKELNLDKLRGKITVINYWASWCGPCVTELPTLQKLRSLRPRINIITVSIDTKKDETDLKAFLLEQGLPEDFPVYFDKTEKMKKVLKTKGLPTSYVIGKDGQVLYQFIGDADWSSKTALAFFDFLNTLPVSKKPKKP